MAENAISEHPGISSLEIKERIINHIDKELAGRAVNHLSTRHRNRSAGIGSGFICFIHNGFAGCFLLHISGHSAALDHEITDHTMKNRSIIMPGFDIIQKIFDCYRGIFFEKFQNDIPE